MDDLKKRKWIWARQPMEYEISGCDCGSTNVTWSEYERHLWCFDCQKDFIPQHAGVFDGPILVHTTDLLISLDIVVLVGENAPRMVKCGSEEWNKILFDENYNFG